MSEPRKATVVRQPWLDPLVTLADDQFSIPGTTIRFGMDAVIGALFPAVGDSVMTALSCVVVVVAWKDGAPVSILLRMVFNVALDAVSGSIPIVGDLIDVGFRANRRNHTLLRAFQQQRFAAAPQIASFPMNPIPQATSSATQRWLLATILVVVALLLIALPIGLFILVVSWLMS